MQEGLEEHHGLPQAGVEIVMDGIEGFPIAFRVRRLAVGESLHRGVETAIQFIDKIGEGGNLVKELGFSGEEDLAEEVIEPRDPLAPGILKILRGQRGKIGSGAKMLGVFEHRVEQRAKREGEPLTEGGGNRKYLISLGVSTMAAHAKGFVQTYTEHGVGSFQTVHGIQIGIRLFASEGKSPILRH